MPSDLVWVALITSGAVLASAWLTARFTSHSTKLQIEAQAEATGKQIEHLADEARRNRMIEARKGHLVSIRDTLSRMFGAFTNYSARIINIDHLIQMGRPPDDPDRQFLQNQLHESVDTWIQEVNALQSIRAQLSDSKLISLVDDFCEQLGQITTSETDAYDVVVNRITEAREEMETLQPKLVPINQRIEELLSGDDLE